MICLGKNKFDERYNISDEGIITDLNGTVQETYLYHGRPTFKGIFVHRIQIYTNNEWRCGKDWIIHHIDENKLNNHLNNLQYLTHQEHNLLHHKGKHYSEETKKKMSDAKKGQNNPMYGKHMHWKKDPITGKRIYY